MNHSIIKKDIQTEEDVEHLVHTFYGYVQKNERLNYIFGDVANVDWGVHLPNMVDFWSNLLFQTGRYKGRPFRHHMPLPIKKDDFFIWLNLFNHTVDELFTGEKAEYAKEIASKIAASFSIRMEMAGKFDEQKDHKE